jgi:hypothetical protein
LSETRRSLARRARVVLGLSRDLLARDDRFWQLVSHPERLALGEAARRALDAEHGEGPVPGTWGIIERARGFRAGA